MSDKDKVHLHLSVEICMNMSKEEFTRMQDALLSTDARTAIKEVPDDSVWSLILLNPGEDSEHANIENPLEHQAPKGVM